MKSKLLRTIPIEREEDIVTCRRACREEAKKLKFNLVDQTRITTASSELARNIFEYAKSGEVRIEEVEERGIPGLQIVFQDHGPGIVNVDQALEEGWTSHRGMGLGLPGAKKTDG